MLFASVVTAQRARADETTVVFAVQRYSVGEEVVDPIVLIDARGRFSPPPIGGDTPQEAATAERFIKDFFRTGRKYRLLFGGGAAGMVAIKNYQEPGCIGMTAAVSTETEVKLGGEVFALATNSEKLGAGSGAGSGMRRAPTDAERAAAVDLARQVFKINRVAPARLNKMETNNLTAVDLDRDGRAELIGSFIIKGKYGVEAAVYLIAEPSGAKFISAMKWFARGEEADAQYRRLVDVLDLDADGTMEVLTQGIYYESHDFMIYKKQGRAWRVVYTGGGGGC